MKHRDTRPSEDHIIRTREYVDILLPALREVARRYGYALAVHGSLERDIDLIAVPWREPAMDAQQLVQAIFKACEAITGFATWPCGWKCGDASEPPVGSLSKPDVKPHGRLAWSIMLGGGPYIDLSVVPTGTP